jgi:hypothetical protein
MADTTIYCGAEVRKLWPIPVAAQWAKLYPELFDADDVRLTCSQPRNHFSEWFAAIHLFHRDGVLSLVEKYIYEGHARKREKLAQLNAGLLEQLWDIRRSVGVQPPDLLVYSRDNKLQGFVEVKGPGDRGSPTPRQYESHREIERRLGVPVEVINVRLVQRGAS